ncbi:hypothetical protein BDFB_014822 [Asbolus verrucosus]|uniref:Uncharacterized protein n=1 Tax=Asbolus verrucosus TaxID=1661398 RepID=A0A482W137_ASBVE|nr:hypothetical protein BDFB_014822 [Asbolus verrucosus]
MDVTAIVGWQDLGRCTGQPVHQIYLLSIFLCGAFCNRTFIKWNQEHSKSCKIEYK